MKTVKALLFLVACTYLSSCSDDNTVYYDLPAMLNMTKNDIGVKLGKPESTRKMKDFGANTPNGFITIPTETIMDTYSIHGYALRIYYIPEKCEKPINFYLYKDDDNKSLDSAAIIKLKRAYNLTDTTQLPKSVYQRADRSGLHMLNIECR